MSHAAPRVLTAAAKRGIADWNINQAVAVFTVRVLLLGFNTDNE
jgi:hypothetical protein